MMRTLLSLSLVAMLGFAIVGCSEDKPRVPERATLRPVKEGSVEAPGVGMDPAQKGGGEDGGGAMRGAGTEGAAGEVTDPGEDG